MGSKTVFFDDIDGSDLGEQASPVKFSLEGKSYSIYLSDENKKKLTDALDPYIKNAETGSTATASSSSKSSASAADKELNQKMRAWAQSSAFKYMGANGKMRTIGDRGQIPPAVVEGYNKAHPSD